MCEDQKKPKRKIVQNRRYVSGPGTGRLNTNHVVDVLNISRPTLYVWIDQQILTPLEGMYSPALKKKPILLFSENAVKELMSSEQKAAYEKKLKGGDQPPLSSDHAAA